jgi:hypothetical protein
MKSSIQTGEEVASAFELRCVDYFEKVADTSREPVL